MSDYSTPSPEDEVADAGQPVDSDTPFDGSDDEKTENVSTDAESEEDTVSGGAPEPPD
jgi:hypothetical protein